MTRRLPHVFLALLLLAAAAPIAPAQQPQPRKEEKKQVVISNDGTEVLQYLLDRARIKPVKASELGNLGRMDDVIVISLGDPNTRRNGGWSPLSMAYRAVQEGGAALVAADDSHVRFRTGNFITEAAIPNATVFGAEGTKAESLFMERPNLPFVVPLPKLPNADGAEWEVFRGLSRIATNAPSYLVNPNLIGEFGSRLATYPDDCFVRDAGQNQRRPVDQDRHFFALGGSGRHPNRGRDYRFLALADPSVFLNQMMLASDANGMADNLVFSARVVEFLAERDQGGRRTRCIFYSNGEIVERFDTLRNMMQPPMPLPNIMAMQDKLTDFANKLIDDIETKDAFNKILVGEGEDQRNRQFVRIMELILGLFLIRIVYYFVRRTWMAKRPPDGPSPPAGGLPSTEDGERPPGVFDRRQRELLRRNNLYEPVRMLVRDMFADAGAPENPGKRFPEVEISNVVLQPDTLVDALTDLWKIAYGPARVVTVQRWKLLEPLFERVRQAHADGKWRFV